MVTITISIRPCLAAYLYVQPPEIYNYPGRDRAPSKNKRYELDYPNDCRML